jgi:hypothetical protein
MRNDCCLAHSRWFRRTWINNFYRQAVVSQQQFCQNNRCSDTISLALPRSNYLIHLHALINTLVGILTIARNGEPDCA